MQTTVRNQGRLWLVMAILFGAVTCLSGQEKKSQIPLFRVNVDTVYVKVAVTDPLHRYVTDLEKEYFTIYEDKVQQTVTHFSQQSAPISVGFIFDVSNSMGFHRNIRISKQWFTRILKTRNPADEYFLITFNQTVNLVESFTNESAELQNDIAIVKAGGWTALYDAIYRGLDKVKEGKNERKALIVISDGEENSSRYRHNEVLESFKESDVPIYAIGFAGPVGGGNYILKSLTEYTGGRIFFGGDLEYYINLIHAELRNQYLLGYVPTNKARDGKWRQILVKLDAPPGFPKLKIVARKGYYASKF